MNSSKKVTVIIALLLTFALLITSAFVAVISVNGGAGLNNPVQENTDLNDSFGTDAATTPAPLVSPYKAFEHGSTYTFTDKTKVDAFRAGTGTDTTTVTVDKYQPHGSQENPFVIMDTTDWNNFADNVASISNGDGKYFVLAADLNFGGATIKSVVQFEGTFYGLGHTISNFLLDVSGIRAAIFGLSQTNITVTDLNVYVNDESNYAKTCNSAGTICGSSNGSSFYLNCHSNYHVSDRTSLSASRGHIAIGGIVGDSYGSILFYRCSAKVEGKANNYHSISVGGMIGSIYSSVAMKSLDCYGSVNGTFTSTNNVIYTASIVGILNGCADLIIENCAGIVSIDYYGTHEDRSATLISAWNGDYAAQKLSVKNCYVFGKGRWSDTGVAVFRPSNDYTGNSSRIPTGTNNVAENVQYAVPTIANYGLWSTSYYLSVTNTAGEQQIADVTTLWNNASNDGYLSNKIWDFDILKKADATQGISPTLVAGSPDIVKDSPNRNDLKNDNFSIEFYNYEKVGGVFTNNSVGVTAIKYNSGETPMLSSPGVAAKPLYHEFKGWTTDLSGNTEPFMTLPANCYGDIVLYAYWEIADDALTKKVTAKLDGAEDSNRTVTMEYSSGKTIELEASVTAMSNVVKKPNVSYTWFVGAAEKSTAAKINPTLVADSGSYVVEYFMYDEDEPLLRRREKLTSEACDVTITKGQPQLDTFALTDPDTAYFGKSLRDVAFSATFIDASGKAVAMDKCEWEVKINRIQDGSNTHNITFTPVDKDNYETVTVPCLPFNSTYITITFDMSYDIGRTAEVKVEYGNTYSSNSIRAMFNTELAKITTGLSIDGWTPQFTDDMGNTNVDVNDYNGKYEGITESKTITVSFVEKTYIVTFDPNNGQATFTREAGYNKNILEPTKPTMTGATFEGWEFDYVDPDTGATSKKIWDFEEERVTKDITLTAKWITVNLTLTSITITVKNNNLTALDSIKAGDLEVIAHYTTDVTSPATMDIPLSFSEYKNNISYETPDKVLHAGSYTIKITYDYPDDSEPAAEATKTLTVKPIEIDTSAIPFPTEDFRYDGTVKKITAIPTGSLPEGITSVEYTYFKGREDKGHNGVTEIGTYTVVAEFTCTDSDYHAESITTTLKIKNQVEVLTVEWDTTTFSYNTLVQHPTATLKTADGATLPASITFHYTGDTSVSAVKNNYSITAVLDDTSVYSLDPATATTPFSIIKAELDAPTFDNPVIYDGTIKNVETLLTGFDANLMEVISGGSGSNAASYSALVKLKDPANSSFKGTSSITVTVAWRIDSAPLSAIWDSDKFVFVSGQTFSPVVTDLVGLADSDRTAVDFSAASSDFIYGGDRNVSAVGAYSISVSLNASSAWTANYDLNGNADWAYAVVPQAGMSVISIVWNIPETGYVYNGNVQAPTLNDITIMEGTTDVTSIVKPLLTLGGDINSSKWAGDYHVTVTISGNNYFIKSGDNQPYKIVTTPSGEGVNPNGPDNPDKPTNPSGGETDLSKYPIWQLCTMGGGLILSILFACLWANNDKKRKKAEKNTARYKGGMAAFAAVLPVFSKEAVLGMSNMIWSILAFVMVAFTVFMFVMMLISKSRLTKAEEACEAALIERQRLDKEERERKEEEKEAARLKREEEREAERQKREDDLKMMMISMMNNHSAQPAADTKQIVGEVVQALLPAMQAMLPQGQSEIHYIPYQGDMTEAAFNDDEDLEDDDWDVEDDEQDEIYEAELMDDSLAEEPEVTADVPKRMPSNFRARLKVSSEKNRVTYSIIKNEFCAQKSVSYRACGRVEKVKFHGDLIAVIGVAKRSIKLWLALDPNEFDRERYFHKDVSDKPRYEKVPMYLRVGSERAQKRVLELLEALFEKFGIERRRRYEEKPIQELIFTLKGNKLLKDKEQKHLLCESVHVHDADMLDNETAENCIEIKDIAPIENENFESISLDVLDENFLDGQRITLDRLKKKGLVSEDCNGIRIVAGSRISKPLAIHANEFTLSAVKMIVLTGGRAVQLVQF